MVSSGERKDGLIFGMRKYNISDRTMKVKEASPSTPPFSVWGTVFVQNKRHSLPLSVGSVFFYSSPKYPFTLAHFSAPDLSPSAGILLFKKV